MNDPLEKDIEMTVKKYARSKDWLAYKTTSPGHIGIPDDLFISPKGFVIFVEFKRLGKKPTPMQQREIDRINQHHVLAVVVDNIDEGKRLIDAYT